jgi:hypothetical protein
MMRGIIAESSETHDTLFALLPALAIFPQVRYSQF